MYSHDYLSLLYSILYIHYQGTWVFARSTIAPAEPIINADSDNAYNITSSSGSNDGSCAEDLEVDNLSVKDIAALKLPIARLEYLSACSTVATSVQGENNEDIF